jgi:hypothetical protein
MSDAAFLELLARLRVGARRGSRQVHVIDAYLSRVDTDDAQLAALRTGAPVQGVGFSGTRTF